MKKKAILGIITALAMFIAVPLVLVANAADHKTPTAPKDYLDMKNPLASAKDAVARGEELYMKKCKKCHGEKGDGKGSGAKDLEIKPVAFTKDYLGGRADGQLFWIIEKGSANTDMDAFGPGSEANMSKDDIWKMISFIRDKYGK